MAKDLELYVHIPFCVKKCSYCDFLSFPADERTQGAYADALLKEIAYYGKQMKDYLVSTIYIGGGTPSWLDENKMLRILDTIYTSFQVSRDAEISMECNPGTLTQSKLLMYRRAGINRLSIGLQSADDEELKLLGRIHTFSQFLKTYEMARETGYSNINVDLISGIPYQTVDKFYKTLQKVLRLKPNHISAYTLIVEKGTPFYEQYKFDAVKQEAGMPTDILPNEDEVYRIYKLTQQYLKENGYRQYEISNFAHPGFECQHNIGYWTRKDYLGLGLGAASLVDNVRYSNTTDLYAYMENVENIKLYRFEQENGTNELGTNLHAAVDVVTRKAQMEEYMFLGLRLTDGITRNDFLQTFGIPIEGVYKDVLERMKKENLLYVGEGKIYLTDRGMDLGNYVMSQFLQ